MSEERWKEKKEELLKDKVEEYPEKAEKIKKEVKLIEEYAEKHNLDPYKLFIVYTDEIATSGACAGPAPKENRRDVEDIIKDIINRHQKYGDYNLEFDED